MCVYLKWASYIIYSGVLLFVHSDILCLFIGLFRLHRLWLLILLSLNLPSWYLFLISSLTHFLPFKKYILLIMLLQLFHFPPFIPLHPAHPLPPALLPHPPLQFMSMVHTYKCSGFYFSYVILTLPLSIFHLPFMLLILCTFSPSLPILFPRW